MRAFAPAKINLTLHVTGQRDDGYHLLDSLVAFADIGDQITARAAPGLSLAVDGPFRDGIPIDGGNLVLRAAMTMGDGPGAMLTLDKHLPAAAGVGGGSSDAAATLRALSRLWDKPLPPPDQIMALGADVPVCLNPCVTRMQGIGEVLFDAPTLPPVWAVLVNPRIEVQTPAVFAALTSKQNAPMPTDLPNWETATDLAAWLDTQRNDLEPPARTIQPVIGDVLAALRLQPGCLTARMSGSGATCFGLFTDEVAAKVAQIGLCANQRQWWAQAAKLS
ncbi:4-(cytidine 5'-diphospho)-2-C-methyl-D-erythritol kinase [Actibacterium sp. 188UL27-1]|uniref:4-(cytidine 5'-diphospho)-2-C-methyl-D-erythritol kinase n=1 Tax=Actibacterium sp. 188UL27-1 TaxID=2786961 RepID=UPI00351C43EC